MGRLSDTSRTGAQGFSGERGGSQGATGATTLLYAPDLNPDEGIWKHLKCVELKNLCCQSLAELRVEPRKAKERLRHKRDVIFGCLRQPGFEL
jgi:transposase